jgi:predicted amidohydrolase
MTETVDNPQPREEIITEKTSIRVAGAQIPVGTNIQKNKQEILKALDWAKENEVDHLLTPEGSLSGWLNGWQESIDEIKDSLKEIQNHQKTCNVHLHLGTNYEENEMFGTVRRNEIRHYHRDGFIRGVTYKTFVINDMECALGRDSVRDPITVVPLTDENTHAPLQAGGMICNDMWGAVEAQSKNGSLSTQYKMMGLDLIFHSTNGRKIPEESPEFKIFDCWHDAHFRMTAGNCMIPILTVDACTDWNWDGNEEDVNKYPTSSQSGYIDFHGWKTNVPRYGRQYFYHDYEIVKHTPMMVWN